MNDLVEDDEYLKEGVHFVKSLDFDLYRKIIWNDICIKDEKGIVNPIPGIEYFVKSMFTDDYYKFITTKSTNLKNLMPFIKGGFVFIKK